MKFNQLHRLIQRNGWQIKRQRGSHVIYQKGKRIYPVPNHGAKVVSKPLELKIKKEMELK